MVELFSDLFWQTATQMVSLFVPFIVLTLLFKIIYQFIIRGGD